MLGLVPAMRNIVFIYACSFLLCTHAFMESICTHAEDKLGSICPVWHLWLFFFYIWGKFWQVLLCFVSTFNISQCSGLSLGNQNHINDSCSYMKRKFLQAMKRGKARSAPPVTSSRGQEQFGNCRRGVLKTWNCRRGFENSKLPPWFWKLETAAVVVKFRFVPLRNSLRRFSAAAAFKYH